MDYNPCICRWLYVPEIGEIAANLLTIAANFHGQPSIGSIQQCTSFLKTSWQSLCGIWSDSFQIKRSKYCPFCQYGGVHTSVFVGCTKVEGSGNLTWNSLCYATSLQQTPDWCSILVFSVIRNQRKSVVEVSQTILIYFETVEQISGDPHLRCDKKLL